MGEEIIDIVNNLPFSRLGLEEKLIWVATTNGKFNVRSAYYLQINKLKREKGESSRCNFNNLVWKKMWELNVSNTDETFMWKTLREVLPTKRNPFNRKIVQDVSIQSVS